MGSVTIRDVDDGLRAELRRIAADNGHSMEAEMRVALAEHVARHRSRPTLLEAAARFRERTGGVDLPLPERADDALICATARSRGAAVATRDVDGLACEGLRIVNPWNGPAATR